MAEDEERGGRTVHDPSGHPTYIIAKQAGQVNRQENMGISNWASARSFRDRIALVTDGQIGMSAIFLLLMFCGIWRRWSYP